jgi:hypothetical protein
MKPMHHDTQGLQWHSNGSASDVPTFQGSDHAHIKYLIHHAVHAYLSMILGLSLKGIGLADRYTF